MTEPTPHIDVVWNEFAASVLGSSFDETGLVVLRVAFMSGAAWGLSRYAEAQSVVARKSISSSRPRTT